jgi:hypothetical protein
MPACEAKAVEPGATRLYLLTRTPARNGASMTTFNDRENAFENKFAHDAELQFKVAARRDKLIGLWAAAKLGHDGDAADAYAKSIVIADMEEAGDEDVIRKLVADLAGVGIGDAEVRTALADFATVARRQIMEAM